MEPSPLTLLPFPSFMLPKKNKPGDFKGKAFLFPANWGIFKVMQSTLALGSHLSWEMQDEIGLCPGAAAVCTGLAHTGDAHTADPLKPSQEPPGTWS